MRSANGRIISGDLGDADQVGLTIEPAEGSPEPAGAPIFAVQLPAQGELERGGAPCVRDPARAQVASLSNGGRSP
jgi:hypothetical protein